MTDPKPGGCPERVYPRSSWERSHVCGRPIKEDGLCGMHALAQTKRRAKAEAMTDQLNRAKMMAGRLGLPEGCGRYDDLFHRPTVTMTMEQAEELALRLETLEGKGDIP